MNETNDNKSFRKKYYQNILTIVFGIYVMFNFKSIMYTNFITSFNGQTFMFIVFILLVLSPIYDIKFGNNEITEKSYKDNKYLRKVTNETSKEIENLKVSDKDNKYLSKVTNETSKEIENLKVFKETVEKDLKAIEDILNVIEKNKNK